MSWLSDGPDPAPSGPDQHCVRQDGSAVTGNVSDARQTAKWNESTKPSDAHHTASISIRWLPAPLMHRSV